MERQICGTAVVVVGVVFGVVVIGGGSGGSGVGGGGGSGVAVVIVGVGSVGSVGSVGVVCVVVDVQQASAGLCISIFTGCFFLLICLGLK